MEQETSEKWRIGWRQAELGFSSGLTNSCWQCKVQGVRGCGRHSHVCLQNLRIRGHRLGQAVTPVLVYAAGLASIIQDPNHQVQRQLTTLLFNYVDRRIRGFDLASNFREESPMTK